MASFKDRKGQDWKIELDAPTVEELRADHQINLVALDRDPLGPLRNDPMLLVTAVAVLCREQSADRGLSPVQFGKLMPSPPDSMLDAIRDAVISFFPSGRSSHIREVLSKFDQMASKTDEMAELKMQQVLSDPRLATKLKQKADLVIDQEIEKLLSAPDAGT